MNHIGISRKQWFIYCFKHKQYKDTHFGDTYSDEYILNFVTTVDISLIFTLKIEPRSW